MSRKSFLLTIIQSSNRAQTRELFKALILLKLRWGGQAPLNLGKDEELLPNPVDFLVREKGAHAEFFILMPMLETELKRKVEEENRMIDYDWSNQDGLHAVYRPLGMGKATVEFDGSFL